MADYKVAVVITGKDEASGVIGGIKGALGGLGNIAKGALTIGLGAATAGLGALGAVLFTSTKAAMDAQNAEAELDAVLKSTGAAAAAAAEKYAAAQGKFIVSTGMSASALANLKDQYRLAEIAVAKQQSVVNALTAEYGSANTVTEAASIKLKQMQGSLTSLNAQIQAGGKITKTSLVDTLGLVAPAVQMTKKELLDLATNLSLVTRFEDDSIVKGESMLLTFTNIGKDVFPAATEAMLNMAQKFGSMDAASVQLGKALQDPIAGVTALRRVGVMLTDAQEKQIKQFMKIGDIASAQKVILGELNTEFGGLAVAAGQTLAGRMDILKNSLQNIQETIGAALIPVISDLATKFAAWVNSPEVQAGLANLAAWLGVNIPVAIQALSNYWTTTLVPALTQAWAYIQTNVIPAMIQLWQWLSANLPIAIQALSEFWTTTLVPALMQAWAFIQANVIPIMAKLFDWLSVNLPPAIQFLTDVVNNVLIPAFRAYWQFLTEFWWPMLATLWDWLSTNIPAAIQVLTDFWNTKLLPAITAIWSFISTFIIPLFQALANLLTATVGLAVAVLTRLWSETFLPAIKAIWEFIDKNLMPIFRVVADVVQNVLGKAFAWVRDNVIRSFEDSIRSLAEGIVWLIGIIEEAIKLMGKLTGKVNNSPMMGQSPSPFENSIRGIIGAMSDLNRMTAGQIGAGSSTGGDRTTNYNLYVSSIAPASTVVSDFGMMQSLASA